MVEPISRDLAEIRKRGSLTVLAPYNSTTYFIYQGEPLGYEYELLQAFAKDLGVTLKIVVVTDPKSLLPLLNSGEGDIAAARLIPTTDNQTAVSFTRALYHTEPVLVQQGEPPSEAGKGTEKVIKPGPADPLPEIDIQARLVTKPSQLAGRTVDLPQQSPYNRTLVELSDEISGEIYVVEASGKIQDETLAQKGRSGRGPIHRNAEEPGGPEGSGIQKPESASHPGPNSECLVGGEKKLAGLVGNTQYLD